MEVNQSWLSNILCGATYGNDTFYIRREKGAPKSSLEYREDIWAEDLLQGRSVIGVDVEEGESRPITLNSLMEGLEKYKTMEPEMAQSIIDDDGAADMWDYYNLMQVVMYGDIIYG